MKTAQNDGHRYDVQTALHKLGLKVLAVTEILQIQTISVRVFYENTL